jgi:two-component system cell cycle sensor histidine kinase/response regulator CckA
MTPDSLASLHDLGNLLTVIGATTERLRTRHDDDLASASLLIDLSDATRRATQIVWEMKRGVRDDREIAPLDVVAFVRDLQRSLSTVAGSSVALSVDTRITGASVTADRRMIEQALLNLVSHARDAMAGAGQILLTVEVLSVHGCDSIGNQLAPGDYAAIAVRDSGPGFSVSSIPKLFEPFYTTKPTGTGLGLRLVADVARVHGGGVFAIGEPGRGATFTLVIPVTP